MVSARRESIRFRERGNIDCGEAGEFCPNKKGTWAFARFPEDVLLECSRGSVTRIYLV
jgi:hypothetical protein